MMPGRPPPCARRALPLHPAAAAHWQACGRSGRGPQLPQQCPPTSSNWAFSEFIGMIQEVGHRGALRAGGEAGTGTTYSVGRPWQDARPRGGLRSSKAAERLEAELPWTAGSSRYAPPALTCRSALRVLEMTITLVPEIFSTGPGQPLRCCCGALAQVCPSGQGSGAWGHPSGELPHQRVPAPQLLNQVLNRVTAEREPL